MTSQGSEAGQLNRAFRHAIGDGDLEMALAVARDNGGANLEWAARLLHLMVLKHSPMFGKAAARWMARFARECAPSTVQIAEAADALAEMGAGDAAAAEVLLKLLGTRRTVRR
jgi:hypothetical protein